MNSVNPLSVGNEIRRLLEEELGEMGVLTYKKQCWDIGLNPERLKMEDIARVARGVARALAPIIGQDKSNLVEKKIIKFKFLAELGEVNREIDPTSRARKGANAALSLGEIAGTLGEHTDAERYYKQAIRHAQKANLSILEAKAYRGLGHIHRDVNEWDESKRWFKKSMELSDRIGDNLGRVDAYRGLGKVLWNMGEFDKAMEIYHQAVEISTKIKDKDALGSIYIDLGNVYNEKGDLDEAKGYYEKAFPLLEETKNYRELARAYNNIGDIMLQRKEWENAIEYFQKCKIEAEKILSDLMTGWSMFNLAEAQMNLGKLEEAQENANRSLSVLRVTDDERGISSALKLLGDIYAAKKDWLKADEALEESLEYAEKTKSPHYVCRTLVSWSAAKLAQGKKKEAKNHLSKAKQVLGEIEVPELRAKMEEIEEKL